MSAPIRPNRTPAESVFELRWSQWLANGAFQDRLLQKRAVTAALVLGCGVAAWLAAAISWG